MSQDNHCSLDDLRFKRFTHALQYQQEKKRQNEESRRRRRRENGTASTKEAKNAFRVHTGIRGGFLVRFDDFHILRGKGEGETRRRRRRFFLS